MYQQNPLISIRFDTLKVMDLGCDIILLLLRNSRKFDNSRPHFSENLFIQEKLNPFDGPAKFP